MHKNNKKTADLKNKNLKKGAATRQRVLAAATRVFAKHSYNAASIRMVGKEGQFDHGIIRYYFTSKAELFEAVITRASEAFYKKHISWLDDLHKTSLETGFPLYLDQMLDYHFNHPETIRIFMKNLAQTDTVDTAPGYRYIPELIAKSTQALKERVRFKASSKEVNRFMDIANTLVFSYVGASAFHAATLGLKPDGKRYREYVKETLIYFLLPHYRKLIFPDP